MKHLRIIGTGSVAPEGVLSNRDLEQMLDTTDEWIRERTGIVERRKAAPEQTTKTMAAEAGRRAMEAAGVEAAEIDLVLVATVSPDLLMPSTATLVQHELGATNAWAFDLSAACSGFLYGLAVAQGQALAGTARTILLIGAETLSRFTDYSDRGTAILFGDGAGAAVLRVDDGDEERGVLATRLLADGSKADFLYIAASGSSQPDSHAGTSERQNYIRMNGREVFRHAVHGMSGACRELLESTGTSIDRIRWLVPHQANARIVASVAQKLGFPEERIFVNLERYGNTSAASIPLALDELVRGGNVKEGDLLLLTAFGGGFAWGAALVRW